MIIHHIPVTTDGRSRLRSSWLWLMMMTFSLDVRVQWVEMARVMMVEAEWRMSGHKPSMEEYMPIAEPSFGLGTTVLTFLFFVGPELPEDFVR